MASNNLSRTKIKWHVMIYLEQKLNRHLMIYLEQKKIWHKSVKIKRCTNIQFDLAVTVKITSSWTEKPFIQKCLNSCFMKYLADESSSEQLIIKTPLPNSKICNCLQVILY